MASSDGKASSPSAFLEPLETLSPSNLTSSPAWSVSFSVDGKYLAVCFGNPDTHVKVWEEHKISTHHRDRDDGDTSTSAAATVEMGSTEEEWKLIGTIREDHTRTIRSVAFAPTSTTLGVPILATASFDGKVLIWEHCPDADNDADDRYRNVNSECLEGSDFFEPIAQLEGHESEVKCLAWNATGSLLASCGRDKTVWVWECFLPGTVGGDATSRNAMFGAGEEEDQGEFECLAVLQGHGGDVKFVTFGPSHGQWGEGEEVLYSASYDNTIRVWAEEGGDWYCAATLGDDDSAPQSVVLGAEAASGPAHASTVWCLGLAPGGVRMFSGSEDGSIAVWKMYTAAERRRMFPQADHRSSTDGLWNCVGRLPDAHAGYAVLSVDCAPSRAGHGRVASGGGDNCINIYREETTRSNDGVGGSAGAPKFSIEAAAAKAHHGDVNCVRWHPRDGTRLVSCGDDGSVRLWKYRRG